MSEKLLVKPPFRFLHDVIIATLEATGYPQGLFADAELQSENVADKDAKLKFLNKIIVHVGETIGEPVACDPKNVIAGKEPAATNLFLRALYRAATGKFSKPAAPQQAKEQPKVEEERKKRREEPKKEEIKREEVKKEEVKKEEPKKEESKREDRKREENRKEEGKRREERKREETKKEDVKKAEPKREEPKREDRKREETKREEPKREEPKREEPKREEARKVKEEPKREEARKVKEEPKRDEEEKAKPVRPQTASKRPPKVKSNIIEEESKVAAPAKPTGVILESKGGDEDEEVPIVSSRQPGRSVAVSDVKGQDHGKLVRDILKEDTSAKKTTIEYSKEDSDLNAPEGKKIRLSNIKSSKADVRKTIVMTVQDLDELKNAIQQLCQSTNPLGKSIDLVNDDIESMNREYERWRRQYSQAQVHIGEEKKITNDKLQASFDKLAEIEEQIKDKEIKINNTKAQILKNEQTIRNLLQTVVSAK
jgi:TRAF3-interacting protein 1